MSRRTSGGRPPRTTMKEFGRRLYLDSQNTPFSDLMTAKLPQKAMQDAQKEKQSEFKKPYMDYGTYPEMEHYQGPRADGFSFDYPSWPLSSVPDISAVNLRTQACQFFGSGDFWGCVEPVIVTLVSPHSTTRHGKGQNYRWTISGAYTHYIEGWNSAGRRGPYVVIWPDISKIDESGFNENYAVIDIVWQQTGFNPCVTQVQIGPCCPPDVEISWDTDSSPETIVAGNSIDVYVKDGHAPYTWAVSGTGYSFSKGKTLGVSNTLNCASGTPGVDYGPTACVVVTDGCGDTTTAIIVNTVPGEFCSCWSDSYIRTSPPPNYKFCWSFDNALYPDSDSAEAAAAAYLEVLKSQCPNYGLASYDYHENPEQYVQWQNCVDLSLYVGWRARVTSNPPCGGCDWVGKYFLFPKPESCGA